MRTRNGRGDGRAACGVGKRGQLRAVQRALSSSFAAGFPWQHAMRPVGCTIRRARLAPRTAQPRAVNHQRRCLTTVTSSPRKRVVLGMSGGVDSSVAALILSRNPAYELVGVYMKNWDSQEETVATKCTEEEDNRYLDSIGKQLGLQIHRIDFVKQVRCASSRRPISPSSIGITSSSPHCASSRWVTHRIPTFYATGRSSLRCGL